MARLPFRMRARQAGLCQPRSAVAVYSPALGGPLVAAAPPASGRGSAI